MSPYRRSISEASETCAEFFYRDGNLEKEPPSFFLHGLALGAFLGALAVVTGHSRLCIAVVAGMLAWAMWCWWRSRRVPGIVLRVENRSLLVMSGSRVCLLRVELSRLLDVCLDTQTANNQFTVRSSSMVQTNTFTCDVARILLVCENHAFETFALNTDYVSHTDCVAWLGKIRLFLRSQDWVPGDERKTDE
jgi:hypothetical protein